MHELSALFYQQCWLGIEMWFGEKKCRRTVEPLSRGTTLKSNITTQ